VSEFVDTHKRRIGILIDRWDPRRGGAERALATFAAWLEARGHEILVFGVSGPTPGEFAPGLFVPVQTHGLTRSARERRLSRALTHAAREMKCDLTIGIRHLEQVDFYWPHGGAHAATLKALGKRRTGRHKVFLDLERAAVADGGARRVICVSSMVRQEMLDFYPTCANRLRVVPNGLDLEQFHIEARTAAREQMLENCGWAEGLPILTFVARNPKLKGLPVLLKALSRLRKRPWRLVIAGPKHARRWRTRARRMIGDESRIHVTEEMDPLVMAAGSDLLVLPSRRDTSGLVVMEALATGTPVLVTRSVGAADLIQSPEQGEVCPARPKASDLANRISGWLDRIELGDLPRKKIAAATSGGGLERWMTALEKELLELDGSKAVL
jgi:UDP-glucose:(heptosyl)LPS alpha-1,3-glucosyltransferase